MVNLEDLEALDTEYNTFKKILEMKLKEFEKKQRDENDPIYGGSINEVDAELAFLYLKSFEFKLTKEYTLMKYQKNDESEEKMLEKCFVKFKDDLYTVCTKLTEQRKEEVVKKDKVFENGEFVTKT